MNKASLSVKNVWISLLITTYTAFFGIWFLSTDVSLIDSYSKPLFPWIIIALIIQLYCFFGIKKVSLIDIGMWFLLLSYLFMYGYMFIDYFELETNLSWVPITKFNQATIFYAITFINLSLNMFSLGYLISYKSDKAAVQTQNEENVKSSTNIKFTIGMLMAIVGGVCQLITSAKLIMVTQNAGSYLAYTEAASSGLIDDIAFLFVPGIIYMLTSKKLTKSKAFFCAAITIVIFSVIMLLSGSRKIQIFGILAIGLCYLFTYKPPKMKFHKKVLIFLSATVFLNMIYIIRENRMRISQVIPAFLSSLTNLKFIKNIIPEVLAETGITFCSVASVIKCVPNVFPYEFGNTIVRSVVSILPIGWLIPDFFTKASTTTTINTYLDLPVGGSLWADLYWNWGWFGIVFAFVIGVILSNASVKLQKKSYEAYFSIFYILLIGVRAGMFEIIRPLFIVTFIPFALNILITSRMKKTMTVSQH